MHAYRATLVVHVLAAVLGLGPVAAIAVIAAAAPADTAIAPLRRLLALSSGALALLIVSGGLLMFFTRGLYGKMGWFQLSMALVLLLGVILGRARRGLRGDQAGSDPARTVARLERPAWIACVLGAAIVVLMVSKPW